ncbi:NnrS family protein [Gephyromycinifex aptenodytis]|uniref:NnrS family protein n=1 Tax=Gephyromycinifex aptenodytis TaxID=2716227 RepID=UPI001446A2BD|nr:NnrS family protein [Gephyromycinifex aptenodytis]
MGASVETTWPGHGPWVASYRVLFALLAFWAAVVIPAWSALGLGGGGLGWHVHEMVFGVGGGALAGYLPTACTSWTGRAPISGRPVMILAALWILARVVMSVAPGTLPTAVTAVGVGAVFWWIAVIVGREMHRSIKPIGGYPRSLIVFCVIAGAGSGFVATRPVVTEALANAMILLFTTLLTGVGGRMVPAFVNWTNTRLGVPVVVIKPVWRRAALVLLGTAIVTAPWPSISASLGMAAAVVLVAHMARWPYRNARHDSLALMTLVAFCWIPVGLVLWGLSRLGVVPLEPMTASHCLTIGALGGLVIAVMSRAPARRGGGYLHVRAPALLGFLAVMLSAVTRLAELNDLSGWLWAIGWALVFVAHLPAFSGPVPRPIFSARRLPAVEPTS